MFPARDRGRGGRQATERGGRRDYPVDVAQALHESLPIQTMRGKALRIRSKSGRGGSFNEKFDRFLNCSWHGE